MVCYQIYILTVSHCIALQKKVAEQNKRKMMKSTWENYSGWDLTIKVGNLRKRKMLFHEYLCPESQKVLS